MATIPPMKLFARMDELESRLLGELRGAGFARVYTPTFAPLEDYGRQLGDEVRTEFLTLVLAEEQVLRPEFTTKVVQASVEATSKPGTVSRLAYAGPTFRVQRQTGPFPHEFQQLGGEILGSPAPQGDVEVLCLLDRLSRVAGERPWNVTLSHSGLLESLLIAEGCPSDVATHIRQDLHRLGRHRERLLAGDELLRDVLPRMLNARARRVGLAEPTTELTLVEWERSVLAAEWAAAGAPTAALELVDSTSRAAGTLDDVSAWAKDIAGSNAGDVPLRELHGLMEALTDQDLSALRITLDPCVVRDLGYYSGIVFDLSVGVSSVVIGGGGRYDRLAEAVGSPTPRPAIGFALDLGALAATTEEA